ncbi:unnamed protein product [Diamesa serratosioi]
MSKVTKKKHVSKKTRKTWRNVDVADVENYLEEKRFEERIGDVSLQKDDELFSVEKKAPKIIKSARELRKIKAKELAKCFTSLTNESKVKDPIAKRNIPLLSNEERKHPATMAKIKRNKEMGIISDEMKLSLNARIEFGKTIPRAKSATKEFQKDLWSGEDLHAKLNKSEWMTKPLRKYHLMNSGTPDVNMPEITHERRTQLRAIDEPMPGISYNPDVKDYEDLINTVIVKEEAIIKKEQKLNRAIKPLFAKITKAEIKRRKREELTQGFPINGEDSVDEDLTDTEYQAINPPVRNKKKDTTQRRKQKELKLRNARQNLEKLEIKKIKDLNTLNMFKNQIKKVEAKVEVKQLNRAEKQILKKFETHRLARMRFVEEDVPIPESTEKIGNLRTMQPEGNILIDRFKSLQKRNIIAPNTKRRPRNRRLTKITKRSHKETVPQPLTKAQKKLNSN